VAKHPPAHRRAIIKAWKAGGDPLPLLQDARTITDPAQQAEAVFLLSGDRRLPWDESFNAIKLAIKQASYVERVSQRGETWAFMLKNLPQWREDGRNKNMGATKDLVRIAAIKDVTTMPDGEWTLQAINALAPYLPRLPLLERAVNLPGFEKPAVKEILRYTEENEDKAVRELIEQHPILAAHFALKVGGDPLGAWDLPEEERMEALRVLIWNTDHQEGLDAIAKSAKDRHPVDRVLVLAMLGGRADKLNLPKAKIWLESATHECRKLPNDSRTSKVQRKVDQALEKAGLKAPPERKDEVKIERLAPGSGKVFAIVNTYDGGLKITHLRAIAKAAPLCVAFDLDLALVDFPTEDLEGLVEQCNAETRIGAEGRYIQQLHDAERIHLGKPGGNWVATTPNPDPEKAGGLDGDVLLMGLGPNGLSKRLLNEAPVHYELTGKNVHLETATAMGILADRFHSSNA
jgi:hypothetical protein